MVYIIIIGILTILVFWIISAQKSFLVLDENVNNSISQIGVQLSSQWEAISSLIAIAKGHDIYEGHIVPVDIDDRYFITKDSSLNDVRQKAYIMTKAVAMIMDVADRHPDITMDLSYKKAMNALGQYEKMVYTSRLIYNDSVTKFNSAIGLFPGILIAGMLGFSKREYLEKQV